MSLNKIFLLPISQTQSECGKEENGKRLFTTREEKEKSGKTDEDYSERAVVLYQDFFSLLPWHLKKKQEYHFITLMIDKQNYRLM